MEIPSNIKAIVLDFDNCIVLDEKTGRGSEDIKCAAWHIVFPEISTTEIQKRINTHKTQSRYEIITALCEELDSKTTQYARGKHFNELVQQGISIMGITDDVRLTLRKLSEHYYVALNTATPRISIIESLISLNIVDMFHEIYTYPHAKDENIKTIIQKHNLKAEDILFIDDTSNHLTSVQKLGCQVIQIITKQNLTENNGYHQFPTISTISELTFHKHETLH